MSAPEIRTATRADEADLLQLVTALHAEGGMSPLDEDKVREAFAVAFDRRGGTIAVIGPPGEIAAAIFLKLETPWYGTQRHIEAVFHYVRPAHRQTDFAARLLDFAKQCSVTGAGGARLPLIMPVLTNKRMAGKMRLMRKKFGMPFGGFFAFNMPWALPSDEDLWRVPSVARILQTRADRYGKQTRTPSMAEH